MKRILTFIILAMMACVTYAQKDVTKFLGIPVDGTKAAMRQKLIAKGFTPKRVGTNEWLEGQFNGYSVRVSIVTNNNKVCRIMVSDAYEISESSIKIRFNNLVRQFENNEKYSAFSENQTIPDDEDISFNMSVKNKRYEAIFYQKPNEETITKMQSYLQNKYTQEERDNPTDEVVADVLKFTSEVFVKKCVWFLISENYGEYGITMYYDNEYNRANGDDL